MDITAIIKTISIWFCLIPMLGFMGMIIFFFVLGEVLDRLDKNDRMKL